MIPAQAVEAALIAVRAAMIEFGPDGHTDGDEEITRAALEAAAPHMLARAVDAAETVLIAHQRQSTSACLCGWSKLGESHPGHQAAMLHSAGVLK